MKATRVGTMASVGALMLTCLVCVGCGGGPQKTTGFLSSYSHLETAKQGLVFMDSAKLAKYNQFIIEPVSVQYYNPVDAKKGAEEEVRKLANKMHSEIVAALAGGYEVVAQPGPGIARLRIAITNIKADTPALNVLPTTKITGAGLGSASMEVELVDSQTDDQIGAAVFTRKGDAISLDGLSKWSSAEAVIKRWAADFRKHIDTAHGK